MLFRSKETVYFTSNDEFCAEEIQRRNPDLVVNKNKGGSAQRYSITPRLMEKIRNLGLNKKSHEKRVPENYMVSSKNQRFDLLRGLMDSDGSVIKNNRAFFHTTNKMLAEDVQQLVWSLGGVAQIRSSDRTKEQEILDMIDGLNTIREICYEKERLLGIEMSKTQLKELYLWDDETDSRKGRHHFLLGF